MQKTAEAVTSKETLMQAGTHSPASAYATAVGSEVTADHGSGPHARPRNDITISTITIAVKENIKTTHWFGGLFLCFTLR